MKWHIQDVGEVEVDNGGVTLRNIGYSLTITIGEALKLADALTEAAQAAIQGEPAATLRWADNEHHPEGSITCECGKPALADGSTLGSGSICGTCLDDYYDNYRETM